MGTKDILSNVIGVLSISKLAAKINSQRQECVQKGLVLRKVVNEPHFLFTVRLRGKGG